MRVPTTTSPLLLAIFIATLSLSWPIEVDADISAGLQYLANSQNIDGSWLETDNSLNSPYPTTEEACNVLSLLDGASASHAQCSQWLLYNSPASITEYLARKIISSWAQGIDVGAEITHLLAYQGMDGGWGDQAGHDSNNLDTAFALQALRSVSFPQLDPMSYGLAYLVSTQNLDGGWGLNEGEESNIYVTSLVLRLLLNLREVFYIQNHIDQAVAYISSKQSADGGFGSSPSTVFESSLALNALIDSGEGEIQMASQAVAYLQAAQLANGSWNDDPYSTALALSTLSQAKANLTISTQDFSFSPQTPTPGAEVILSSTITNQGLVAATNVGVSFFDGDPDAGGLLIGEAVVAHLPQGGSASVSTEWTPTTSSLHNIFIVVDAAGAIGETSETDNISIGQVRIYEEVDVAINQLAFIPDMPSRGQPVDCLVTVSNRGGLPAANIVLRLFQEGTVVGEFMISALAAGQIETITFNLAGLLDGNNSVEAVIDPDNAVSEGNEANNTVTGTIEVRERIDLVVSPSSIYVTDAKAKEGETISVSGSVFNSREDAANNVVVRFYDGDPDTGAEQIGSDQVISEIPGGEAVVTDWVTYETAGKSGYHRISMAVDPLNIIQETNEYNNIAATPLDVASRADLMIEDIEFEPLLPEEGEIISIRAIVKNVGSTRMASNAKLSFSFGAASAGTQQAASDISIPLMVSGASFRSNPIYLNSEGKLGEMSVSATADPYGAIDEVSESNNSLTKTVVVGPATRPDLAVSPEDLTIDPPKPSTGDLVTIQAKIHNLKNIDASNVLVRIYDGNPAAGGLVLGEIVFPSIPGFGEMQDAISFSGFGSFGTHEVYAVIDPDNTVIEINEENNSASAIVKVCLPGEAAPVNLVAEAISDTDIELNWEPGTGAESFGVVGYNIYRDGIWVNRLQDITKEGIPSASSVYASSTAEKAVDGRVGTYWIPERYGSVPQWWAMSFSTPRKIHSVAIKWHKSYIPQDFEVQTWDGAAWVTQASVSGNGDPIVASVLPSPITTDKTRILITGSQSSIYAAAIAEVDLYEDQTIEGLSAQDAGLGTGLYSYYVTAVDTDGVESLPSNVVQASVGDVAPPAVPENFATSINNTQVNASWDPVVDPDLGGYRVYRNGLNVAYKGRGASISGEGLSGAHFMTDGWPATAGGIEWDVTDPAVINVVFPEIYEIHKIRLLLHEKTDNGFYRYRIESSQDNENWTTIVDKTAGEWSGWQDEILEQPVRTGFLRIVGTFCSSDQYLSIAEFEAYSNDLAPFTSDAVQLMGINITNLYENFYEYSYQWNSASVKPRRFFFPEFNTDVNDVLSIYDSDTGLLLASYSGNLGAFVSKPLMAARYDFHFSADYDKVGTGFRISQVFVPGRQTNNSFSETVYESKEYVYAVSSIDVNGNESVLTNTSTVTLFDDTSPAIPLDVVGTVGDGSVEIEWSSVNDPDFVGYNVYRDGTTSPLNGTTLITTSTYVDSSVTNLTSYSYRITAVDVNGNESPLSEPVIITPSGIDLTISELDISARPKFPSVFDNISFYIMMHNNGNDPYAQSALVSFFVDDEVTGRLQIGSAAIPSILPGEATMVTFTWNPAGYVGTNTIHVEVDSEGLLPELDESNNSASFGITVNPEPQLKVDVLSVDSSRFPEISANVRVGDWSGEGIFDLTAQEISVFEEGVAQEPITVELLNSPAYKPLVDIVFIFDDTGSMFGPWNGLKEKTTDFVGGLLTSDLDYSLGLVTFKDDVSVYNNGFLTVNENTLLSWINALVPAGGGDGPEDSLDALEAATTMHFREGSQKVFILITDAAPHTLGDGTAYSVNTVETIIEKLKNVGAIAFVVGPDNYFDKGSMEGIYFGEGSIPQETHGKYYNIKDNFTSIMDDLVIEIASLLGDYSISYITANPAWDGTARAINVEANYRYVTGSGTGQYRAPLRDKADLAVGSLVLSNSAPLAGEIVTVSASIQNLGGVGASNVMVQIFDGDPAVGIQLEDDFIIQELNPSMEQALTASWQATPGVHDIHVVVDPLYVVDESDEANNSDSFSVAVPGSVGPELGLGWNDIAFSESQPLVGETITIAATIHNTGADAQNVAVAVYLGNPTSGGTQIGSVNLSLIPANDKATIQLPWTIDSVPGVSEIYIWVDPYDEIREINKADNVSFNTVSVAVKDAALEVGTNELEFTANSDVNISVVVMNEGTNHLHGTGEVFVEDADGNPVTTVGDFNVNNLETVGLPGWHYRIPVTVTAPWDMADELAAVAVDFSDVSSTLGISHTPIDTNSIRVVEFEGNGTFVGEKQVKASISSGSTSRVVWLLNGHFGRETSRYFYIYFDTVENGQKPDPVNVIIPETGKLIAYSDDRGKLYTVVQNGDGSFGAPNLVDNLTTGTSPYRYIRGIALSDFNNDGFSDIVTGSPTTGEIFYYQNRGDGSNTFIDRVVVGTIEPGSQLMDTAVGDFNADGNNDFVISSSAQNKLFSFLGDGAGGFVQSDMPLPNGYNYFRGKAAADIDSDGRLDLVVGAASGMVYLYLGNGDGSFSLPEQIADVGNNPYGIVVGDYDDDGFADVVANNGNTGDAYFLRGNGDGTFLMAEVIPSLDTNDYTAFDHGDFNQDQHLDILAASQIKKVIEIYPGNGNGTFDLPIPVASPVDYALGISSSYRLPVSHPVLQAAEKVPAESYEWTWNTGSTLAGNYVVRATFYEEGEFFREDLASFVIVPDYTTLPNGALDSSVIIDQIAYNTNSPVAVTSRIESTSTNFIFENLTAEVTIQDGQGTPLFTEAHTIPTLAIGQLIDFSASWNTSTNPAGSYPVTLEVKDASGSVLSTSTTTLTISDEIHPAELLQGAITVDLQSLLQGEPVNIAYNVTNIGNIDLATVDLSILTVHAVDETIYDTLTDQTALAMGESFANSQTLDTQSYTAKDYIVILRATISGVEETLAGTYFRVEGAPSAPSLHSPSDGSDVETLSSALSVNNASDPNDDKLTYSFELYRDPGLSDLVTASADLAEGPGATSWQMPLDLEENATYYWRARAFDELLYGEWMPTASFRVNVANDVPTAPTVSRPSDQSEVDTLTPILEVNNASDPDSENLTYEFELYLDAALTTSVSSATGIFEGAGTTAWPVPVSLTENTHYYWRAQADDWLDVGPWMTTSSFFVNTANDAPTAPSILSPADGSEVTVFPLDIISSNATDPDSSVLTYQFELDKSASFDSPSIIRSGSIAEGAANTVWTIENLEENTRYYVRVKSSDGQAESPWSGVVDFFVNTVNEPPTVPILANPSNGGAVNLFTPSLSVHNATDPDEDTLTYEFELYSDALMTSLVAQQTGVAETNGTTAWTVPMALVENNTYYWRARAFDGELASDWMPLSGFMVNTANDAPGAPTLDSPVDGGSLDHLIPTLSVQNAIDPDSDQLTYEFECYANGVLVTTISAIPENASGVTSASLTQELTDDTTYTWRARAYDGDRYGAWMEMASFSIHLPVTTITATIDFNPNTLNQQSQGKWVVVFIELPEGYDVNAVDISTIVLNDTVPAEPWPYVVKDNDKDGVFDLMVKFDRSAVIDILPAGEEVQVLVSGAVADVTFEGVDVIRVIH